MTVKNYLKASLLSILCFIIQGRDYGYSEKSSILNSGEKFIELRTVFDTECCAFLQTQKEIGRSFFAFNSIMLFVSIKFVARKGFCEIFLLCGFIVLCK